MLRYITPFFIFYFIDTQFQLIVLGYFYIQYIKIHLMIAYRVDRRYIKCTHTKTLTTMDWFNQCSLRRRWWLWWWWWRWRRRPYQIRSVNFRLNSLNFSPNVTYAPVYATILRCGETWCAFGVLLFFYLRLLFYSAHTYYYRVKYRLNSSNSSSQITFTLCCFWCDMWCCLVIWFACPMAGH